MEQINYNQVLTEVFTDIKAINKKCGDIDGYHKLKMFIDEIPYKFENDISVKGDVLYFGYGTYRIGKISNIEDVRTEERDELDITFDKTIVVERTKGDDIRIKFKFGQNTENGKWEYIYYTCITGY